MSLAIEKALIESVTDYADLSDAAVRCMQEVVSLSVNASLAASRLNSCGQVSLFMAYFSNVGLETG